MKKTFELKPDWSEEEYDLVSKIRRIFSVTPGTDGKKRAVKAIRKYIKSTNEVKKRNKS